MEMLSSKNFLKKKYKTIKQLFKGKFCSVCTECFQCKNSKLKEYFDMDSSKEKFILKYLDITLNPSNEDHIIDN